MLIDKQEKFSPELLETQSRPYWCSQEISQIFKTIPTVVRFKSKLFYSEGAQLLEEVAHTGCGVSTSEDVQNWTGQSPEQPALVHSSVGQIGLDLQTSLQPEVFYDSVKFILLYNKLQHSNFPNSL